MPETRALMMKSQIVFETLLRYEERGTAVIDEALKAGKRLGVIYVHRSIEAAAVGALVRAKSNKRIYPIDKLSSGHYEAQRTVLSLQLKYAGNDRVGFLVLDNSGDLYQTKLAPVNLLEQHSVKYSNR